jgi:hypothetical protein
MKMREEKIATVFELLNKLSYYDLIGIEIVDPTGKVGKIVNADYEEFTIDVLSQAFSITTQYPKYVEVIVIRKVEFHGVCDEWKEK